METIDDKVNFGWSQLFSILLLTFWVFIISFYPFKLYNPDAIAIFTFIPLAIVACCFWFDYFKSAIALFIVTLIFFVITAIGVESIHQAKIQKMKYKKAKYEFRQLKKAIESYRITYQNYPNPTTSGNLLTTALGSNTLQKVLSRRINDRPFYSQFPDAHLSNGLDASFVCVVTTPKHFLKNQYNYENCILDHNTTIPTTQSQGYVYHPDSGTIRHNFAIKRLKKKKWTLY